MNNNLKVNEISKSYEELSEYKDLFQALKEKNITQTQELMNLLQKEKQKEFSSQINVYILFIQS